MKVVLIIIYNHQYNKNIDIIEKIYQDRFSEIYHLVPFYNGEKENVIPVYESSYYFQGYVSQGLRSFFKEKYSHYFFIADDMILNPIINENNYCNFFKLDEKTSFLPRLSMLHDRKNWAWANEVFRWNIKMRGVEASNQLPDYYSAIDKLSKFGLTIKPLCFSQVYQLPSSWLRFLCTRNFFKRLKFFMQYVLFDKVLKKSYVLSYPLVNSYSDIFIVNAKSIKEFCHYNGVFAVTKLFVEVALPTSMCLSSDKISVEKDLYLRGRALWTKEDYQELEKYENSLPKLLAEFPSNYLYLHPVKLSKWKTEK